MTKVYCVYVDSPNTSPLQIKVPLQVFLAPGLSEADTMRKPNTGMWDFFCSNANKGVPPCERSLLPLLQACYDPSLPCKRHMILRAVPVL